MLGDTGADPADAPVPPTADEVIDETEGAEDETAGEAGDAGAETPAEPAAPTIDPVIAFKRQLRKLPGDWFVIHSYAGYENKVKANPRPAR